MDRNQNHASSSSTKRIKTCDNGGWSNLNHDLLLLVLMRLRLFDFPSFSKVCKSWRSFAMSNKNIFMTSRPPMYMCFSSHDHKNTCLLRDFEQRKFEAIHPLPSNVTYFGLTSGYMMLYGNTRVDFWLVNPITRHQLHFPACPSYYDSDQEDRAILVFSRSILRWVFLILSQFTSKVSFYIEGKRGWKHVSSTLPILDLLAFKGKIYTLHTDCCLGELRLNPKPELTLLETKNYPKPEMKEAEFVSCGETLCIMDHSKEGLNNEVLELDFGEMKWVLKEKTKGEYAFFVCGYNPSATAAIKPELWESWADPQTLYKINHFLGRCNFLYCDKPRPAGMFFYAKKWYFPQDSLKITE